MLGEAAKIGPATIALFEAIMKAKPLARRAFAPVSASCGPREKLRRSARRGGGQARRHAGGVLRHDDIGATYGSLLSILENGLDRAFAKPSTPDASVMSETCPSAWPAHQHPWAWRLPLMLACAGTPALRAHAKTKCG